MKMQRHFEIENETALRELAHIRTMITDLDRTVQILACEIFTEEERALVSDPAVMAQGRAREVSPTIDSKTATVRVKIAIDNPPAAMKLGSPVTGTVRWNRPGRIVLPWSALTAAGSAPAIWIVDPASKTVSLKPIVVDSYATGIIVLKSGLQPGDRVVTDGGKLLSPGQTVTFSADGAS